MSTILLCMQFELVLDNIDNEYANFYNSIHNLIHKINNANDEDLVDNADTIIQSCEELLDEMSMGYVENNLNEIIDFLKDLKEERKNY